jgi:hypothetical protein
LPDLQYSVDALLLFVTLAAELRAVRSCNVSPAEKVLPKREGPE